MINDVIISLEPLKMLIHDEDLVEMSLNVIVSQRPCEEKSTKKMVCTRINCSTWDY
jgi:hypothetical protein